MKKIKSVADRIREMLENEVVELTEKRSLIDEELKVLVKMIGVTEAPQRKRKIWTKKPTGQVAVKLLQKHDEVTAPMLAKVAGVSTAAASAALSKLADDETIKRARRGVYKK